MASFRIYTKKLTKRGHPLVYIIYHEGRNYKIKTNLHCKAWKQDAQMVDGKKDVNAPIINNKLRKASTALQDILDNCNPFDILRIRREFNKFIRPAVMEKKELIPEPVTMRQWPKYQKYTEAGKQFYKLIETYISEFQSVWSRSQKKRVRSIRSKLLAYEPNFEPTMINQKFWNGFVTHCLEVLGNTNNTISSDCDGLSLLIKVFRRDGYNLEVGVEDKIRWKRIESPRFGLSWDRVLQIAKLDLSNHPSRTIRDSQTMWLIGAFTGRRYGEILTMRDVNFYQKEGKWRYTNMGKGQTLVDIPLIPEAVDFLTKIKFKIPLRSGKTVNEDIRTICGSLNFNERVLKITPISPSKVKRESIEMWRTVTFHTSRHSFAQHIVELAVGKPHAEKFIAFMLGHASFQTSWKYINRLESSNDKMFEQIFN